MKKNELKVLAAMITLVLLVLSGCGTQTKDLGEPPAEVISGESAATESNADTGEGAAPMEDSEAGENAGGDVSEGAILENAVSVRIGRDGTTEWNVTMYNNDAALTMLDYLSGSALLFPTYTYEEEEGFAAQGIRGTYTRDEEQTIADVRTGELYLFGDGQLRFYFKDRDGADITATPVGYFTDVEGLTEAVQEAYTSNMDDTWGVDVYFWITKTLE